MVYRSVQQRSITVAPEMLFEHRFARRTLIIRSSLGHVLSPRSTNLLIRRRNRAYIKVELRHFSCRYATRTMRHSYMKLCIHAYSGAPYRATRRARHCLPRCEVSITYKLDCVNCAKGTDPSKFV